MSYVIQKYVIVKLVQIYIKIIINILIDRSCTNREQFHCCNGILWLVFIIYIYNYFSPHESRTIGTGNKKVK